MNTMKSFKQFFEDAPTNAVGSDGGVDMNPTGKKVKKFIKVDRRSRWDTSKLYRRAKGPK